MFLLKMILFGLFLGLAKYVNSVWPEMEGWAGVYVLSGVIVVFTLIHIVFRLVTGHWMTDEIGQ